MTKSIKSTKTAGKSKTGKIASGLTGPGVLSPGELDDASGGAVATHAPTGLICTPIIPPQNPRG